MVIGFGFLRHGCVWGSDLWCGVRICFGHLWVYVCNLVRLRGPVLIWVSVGFDLDICGCL